MDDLTPVDPAPPTPVLYVTYTEPCGALDGLFIQVPPEQHLGRMIVLAGEPPEHWSRYEANVARDGLTLLPVFADIDALKGAKNEEINQWRETANLSSFPHVGKRIACDPLSRSDIDGVANHIALFGAFPEGFPGAWKAMDNTYVDMPEIDAFKAMYASMTAQGAANFTHAQALKMALAAASSADEILAIVW